MEIKEIEDFLTWCVVDRDRQKDTTVVQYKKDLYDFCQIVGITNSEQIANTTYEQVSIYLKSLVDKGYSNASYNKRLSTLKSFYNWLEIIADKVEKNILRKFMIKKIYKTPKRYLTKEEGFKIVEAATNPRDKILIKFGLGTGVRVSELKSIKLSDIRWKTNEIFITRKGHKEQYIVVTENLMVELKIYIDGWRKTKMESYNRTEKETPYLFISNRATQLCDTALNDMLKVVSRKAGIEDYDKIHNHTLRTSYATEMHKEGVSDKAIQIQLGHSNVSTTINSYVQLDNEQVRSETAGKGFIFENVLDVSNKTDNRNKNGGE